MLTRYIGKTESAASMSFYIQLTFLAVCLILGLIIGDGKFADGMILRWNFYLEHGLGLVTITIRS